MKRVVIVGELNPYGGDPDMALYHLPRHASGNRLREHLGLSDGEYAKIAKANLCTGAYQREDARQEAAALMQRFDVVVALGRRVQLAFEGPGFFEALEVAGGWTIVSLPHPSGLNRLWNVAGAREKARALLRAAAPWLPIPA